jgi:DDE family transposase
MVNAIVTVFCICDDYLKTIGYEDDKQATMSTAEILTTAIIGTMFFGGNYAKSRWFIGSHKYVRNMLGESRFIRRLNQIEPKVFQGLFAIMAQSFKLTNEGDEYVIDSFPVPVCANIRISRSKIYTDEEYRGYCASKRQYFFGIRVHMLMTKDGKPIEFIIEPGATSDITVAKVFKFNIPKGSKVHADKGYTDYAFEDYLELQKQIQFLTVRKSNAKRKDRGVCRKIRKMAESAFSVIVGNFARKVHAVTALGFELKVAMFIFAYSIKFM